MANIITGIRIGIAVALCFCPTFSTWFYILYIVGGISDVLDGFVARHFGKVTVFGTRLDTAADIVFTAVVLVKVMRTVLIPEWLIIWTVLIAVIKGYNMVLGLIIHKRFIAEHTALNKICGALLFVIPLCIRHLPSLPITLLFVLTGVVATVAAIQEGRYIRLGNEIR